jgi:hypothetical protein
MTRITRTKWPYITGIVQAKQGQSSQPSEGLQGETCRNPHCPEGTQACVSITCQPHPTPPPPDPNPGLTPLQTWLRPAPQCGPGSCWQLQGARGTDVPGARGSCL